MRSESLLKLYKPKIVKVSQTEKDKYKKQNDMTTFPQIFLDNIKIGGLDSVTALLAKIFNGEKINFNNEDSDKLIKFFLNKK
jgi:glutaredoxin-related protein